MHAFTLIITPGGEWTEAETAAAITAGLTDASFGSLAGDAYVYVKSDALTAGQAIGEAIDQLQASTGRQVLGVQRDPA